MYTYRLILEFQHQRGTLHKLCPVRPPQYGDQFCHGSSYSRPPSAVDLAPSANCYSESLGDIDVPVRRIVSKFTQELRIGNLADHHLSVCVVSLIRLVILLQTDFSSLDLSWSIADFSMWCTVEACFAIISGKYLHHQLPFPLTDILQHPSPYSALYTRPPHLISHVSTKDPHILFRSPARAPQGRTLAVWRRLRCRCMNSRSTKASLCKNTKALSG